MKSVLKKYKVYFVFLIILLVYYILYTQFNIGLPCVFKLITGLYCPGCGITRMIISIIHLDFYQAFRYNPFVFILLVLLVIYLITKFIIYKTTNKKIVIPESVYYILIVLAIIFMILRNIDAFSYLAPNVI